MVKLTLQDLLVESSPKHNAGGKMFVIDIKAWM